MDTKKVAAFIETVRAGSINKAAVSLGYTQSGLTYILNSLEDELGLKLLERNHSGISLTSDAEELYPLLEKLVEDETSLNERLSLIKSRTSGIKLCPHKNASSSPGPPCGGNSATKARRVLLFCTGRPYRKAMPAVRFFLVPKRLVRAHRALPAHSGRTELSFIVACNGGMQRVLLSPPASFASIRPARFCRRRPTAAVCAHSAFLRLFGDRRAIRVNRF